MKSTKMKHQLSIIKENFLSVTFSITEKEMKELVHYQQFVCNSLEWVELSPNKLGIILQPFFDSPYLSKTKYMHTLKKVIYSYYHLREYFDCAASDTRIYDTLYQVFFESAGQQISHLYAIAKAILIKEGGIKRHEPFDTL